MPFSAPPSSRLAPPVPSVGVSWLLPRDRDGDPGGLYARSAPAEAIDPPHASAAREGLQDRAFRRGPAFQGDAGHGDRSATVARPDRHFEKNLSQEAA
jgi:hypothetical protein